MSLPPNFVRNITAFGPAGAQWLELLPALLDNCARRWDLTLLPAFPNLSFNYVANAVRADGTGVVLKIGPPMGDMRDERAALRAYDGRGAVRLLASDDARNVMLLERLTPGETLTGMASEARDAEATAIAADVMRRLWRPAPPDHDFPTVAEWGEGFTKMRARFGGGVGPFPQAITEEAEALFADLLATSDAPVLLHGDLHHDNILSSGDTWLAIDPKGLVGEPAYEVGAMLRNLWEDRHTHADPGRLLSRRAHQLADALGLNPARVKGWAMAQAVLSAWWTVEDGGDYWQSTFDLAHLLREIPI
ncbi:streptomycin 6-kinase [Capsulimonas corticalis]|uniref:Streptomycin 6-kinase n=1 Tax=Capsulimonas corticalis TaxID=2219043 RepID=A0A402D589_9BACT|nr:aminoglycoside phosphotransferase family protein [Capsulimonas corticalis]BDI29861.1 streptomycin 6-kinase [Capsulimonas corticalis]